MRVNDFGQTVASMGTRGRYKPYVVKTGMGWRATVVLGYGGNYESDEFYCPTWREAFDWAHDQVKGWRP